ncbi:MAG TPA: bifunctional phosphoglucose/phosphomannose isomerase [Candidatus Saccharimonadia bacterium]|jgi:glucose/mannose-6-phosphate isomerase
MLDKADFIARYDKEDVLGVMVRLPEQLQYEFSEVEGLTELGKPANIVLAGMGGSAQPGEFIKTWLGGQLPVPFVIVRDYALPAFVGSDTLVIASSYSGNTEETLAALKEAESRGAKVVVMTSGGKLLEAAKEGGHPAFVLPADFQPRMAVLYAVRALTTMLERLGLVTGALQELAMSGKWLGEQNLAQWGVESPQADNAAKQIASELVGHPVVVYAGPALAFAAMKWKIAFNENAKNIAFYNYFPELNHNEFIGWTHPEQSGLKVVELQSSLDHPRVQKRFEVSNRLWSNVFAPVEVKAVGETKLEQLVWVIALGEFVATYLAILNQVDPMPVALVEQLKKDLG